MYCSLKNRHSLPVSLPIDMVSGFQPLPFFTYNYLRSHVTFFRNLSISSVLYCLYQYQCISEHLILNALVVQMTMQLYILRFRVTYGRFCIRLQPMF